MPTIRYDVDLKRGKITSQSRLIVTDSHSFRKPVYRELGMNLHWSFERLDQTDLVWPLSLEGRLVHSVEGPAPAGLIKEVEHCVERGTGSF